MSGTLILEGQTLQFDASFKDDGEPPVYGMVGNMRTLMNPGRTGHPEVFCFQGQFFFKNGELCTKAEDVDWIGEPHRSQALQFVDRLARKPVKRGEAPRRVKLPRRLKVQTRGEVLGGRKVALDVGPVDAELERAGRAT
jgi:hypothetical protein